MCESWKGELFHSQLGLVLYFFVCLLEGVAHVKFFDKTLPQKIGWSYVGAVKKNRLPHGLGKLISKKGKLFYRGKFAEGRICPFDVVRQVKDDKEALKFIQFMGGNTEEDYKYDGFWCACERG